MAVVILLENSLFRHANENRQRPVRVFARAPFAAGAATDFPCGNKLSGPGLQIITNFAFVRFHDFERANLLRKTAARKRIWREWRLIGGMPPDFIGENGRAADK